MGLINIHRSTVISHATFRKIVDEIADEIARRFSQVSIFFADLLTLCNLQQLGLIDTLSRYLAFVIA